MFATFARLLAAIADATVWGWHHPAAMAVLGMASVFVGAFVYVSTRFHRPKGH